jgi:hypothetical protein
MRIPTSLIFLAALASPLLSLPAVAAESYPLVCRGGGAMTASYTIWHSKVQAFRVHFVKARQGAGAQQPGPGECAWLDRPLNKSEPANLEFYTDRGQDFRGMTLETQGGKLAPTSYGHDAVRYMAEAITGQQLFYVRCFYEKEKNRLRVTHVGP